MYVVLLEGVCRLRVDKLLSEDPYYQVSSQIRNDPRNADMTTATILRHFSSLMLSTVLKRSTTCLIVSGPARRARPARAQLRVPGRAGAAAAAAAVEVGVLPIWGPEAKRGQQGQGGSRCARGAHNWRENHTAWAADRPHIPSLRVCTVARVDAPGLHAAPRACAATVAALQRRTLFAPPLARGPAAALHASSYRL